MRVDDCVRFRGHWLPMPHVNVYDYGLKYQAHANEYHEVIRACLQYSIVIPERLEENSKSIVRLDIIG